MSTVIFVIEVAIAKHWIGGPFVRNYIGDILVIALIHFFIRGLFLTNPTRTAIGSVLFGFFVESLQYFHIADLLRLKPSGWLYIAVGNSFNIADFLMYLFGGILALSLEKGLQRMLAKQRPS